MKEILLIDDNPMDQVYMKTLVESMGMNCTVAPDIDSALSLLKGIHFDMIIVDYRMPDIDGLQFLMGYQSLPNAGGVPVVVVTGNMDEQLEETMKFFGAKAILQKPLESKLHSDIITHVLEQRNV